MSILENTDTVITSVDTNNADQSRVGTPSPKQNPKTKLKRTDPPIVVEYAKPPIDIEVEILPATDATPHQVVEDKAPTQAKAVGEKSTGKVKEEIRPLTEEQAKTLAALEAEYDDTVETLAKLEAANGEAKVTIAAVFHRRALVIHKIIQGKLYQGSHTSAETYFADKWNIGRSHAYRLADAGKIIAQYHVSPAGDAKPCPVAAILELFATESHTRPLLKLDAEKQRDVLDLLVTWVKWGEYSEISPRMVESAVLVVNPPVPPTAAIEKKSKSIKEFEELVAAIVATVPIDTTPGVRDAIDQIVERAKALAAPRRSTGIIWTDATWNPLQGCSPASCECDNCYAAELVGTRLVGVYPGLVMEKTGKDGKRRCVFNGTIKLLPERFGEPLKDRTPRRYFVNSMSDLFHKNVPEEFIEAVFEVMEKASWHTFQVLTKRPERMAEFTTKRYANTEPPRHIWLGTSTGNQKAFDDRYAHLLKVKAAVRWISVEPLIGKIEFSSLEGVDWIVVGGESGKNARKMEKEWVTTIRDACEEHGVQFLFKQWGEYGEDGKKLKGKQQKHPPLDGKTHEAYPIVIDAKCDEESHAETAGAQVDETADEGAEAA